MPPKRTGQGSTNATKKLQSSKARANIASDRGLKNASTKQEKPPAQTPTRGAARHNFPTAGQGFPSTVPDKNRHPVARAQEDVIRKDKLQKLKSDLKETIDKYAVDKELENEPETLEDALIAYSSKLIEQVQMRGATGKVKEKQQQEEMKSRLTIVNTWLEKLKDQIDEETFEPGGFTENKIPEIKEINNSIRDICMKLKSKQDGYQRDLNEINKELKDFGKEIDDFRNKSNINMKKELDDGSQKSIRELREKLSQKKEEIKCSIEETEHNLQQVTNEGKVIKEKVREIWQTTLKTGSNDQKKNQDVDSPVEMLNDIETFSKTLDKEIKSYQRDLNEINKELKDFGKEIDDFRNKSNINMKKELDDGSQKSIRELRVKLSQKKEEIKCSIEETENNLQQVTIEGKVIKDKVRKIWQTTLKTSSNDQKKKQDVDSPVEMLNAIETFSKTLDKEIKSRKGSQGKQNEDESQMKEFLTLMNNGLADVKKALQDGPFMFEKPQQQSTKKINDFKTEFKEPLSLMLEVKDIVRENTEWFSVRFVEKSTVVRLLKGMHLFISKEDLAIPNNRQGNKKKTGSKKDPQSAGKSEWDTSTVEDIIEYMKDQFVQRGITCETVADLHKRITSLEDEQNKIQQVNTDLFTQNQAHEDKMKRLTEELSTSQRDVQRLEDELHKLESEKQNLLMRLSKVAGARLMDNNPNIADLSDPNRPTNLGNDYSELYDNQWTNAYEALGKIYKESNDILKFLREILETVFGECVRYAGRQNEIIRTLLVQPTADIQFAANGDSKSGKGKHHTVELSAVISTGVTDLRKQSIGECCKDITQYLKTEHKEWFQKKHVMEYTVRCVEICWLMQMQSPPLHIETGVKSEMKFDKNRYKEYTKIGKKVDFVVWPALLLHREGPLLTKGVAQGK